MDGKREKNNDIGEVLVVFQQSVKEIQEAIGALRRQWCMIADSFFVFIFQYCLVFCY